MPRRAPDQFEMEWLPLDAIDVEDRLRPLDQSHVSRLAGSICELGLQTPITVRYELDDGGGVERAVLVAGAHRLAALRELGEVDTRVFVAKSRDPDFAELWEIDENLARQELSDAQRADHHARREAILVRRGEVAAPGRGGDRTSNGQSGRSSYTAKAAADLGQPERTVRRDLYRGKVIAPDVLADVAGSPLDKGVVLDELASTPRDEQRAKLAEITERRATPRAAPHTNAAAAEVASPSELGPPVPTLAGHATTASPVAPPSPHGEAGQVVLDVIGPEATAALARLLKVGGDAMRTRFRAVISAAVSRLRAEQLAGDAAPLGRWRPEMLRTGEVR